MWMRLVCGLIFAVAVVCRLATPAAAQPTVLVNDTFNYADNAALVAGGWQTGAMGVPAVSNTFFFIGTGSGWISSDPASQPPIIADQTTMRLNNAIGFYDLGVELTQDFTLTAKVAMSAYSRSIQIGLGDENGAGYSLQWNSAAPTTFMGNGHYRIFAQANWSQHSPNETSVPGTAQLTVATSALTPPTRYALPAEVVNPLPYTPNDTFLGYSEMKLVWSQATGMLEAYQDGTLVTSAADADLYNSFTHLYIGGGTNGFIDEVKLETTQEFEVPTDPGDFDDNGLVDGNDILFWQRGQSPNGGNGADLLEWVENFPESSVPAVGAVPEPSSALLVFAAFGCLATVRCRAKR